LKADTQAKFGAELQAKESALDEREAELERLERQLQDRELALQRVLDELASVEAPSNEKEEGALRSRFLLHSNCFPS
jgi:hypothetical protein